MMEYLCCKENVTLLYSRDFVVSPVSGHFLYSRDFVVSPFSRHFLYSRDFVVSPVYYRHFLYSCDLLFLPFLDTFHIQGILLFLLDSSRHFLYSMDFIVSVFNGFFVSRESNWGFINYDFGEACFTRCETQTDTFKPFLRAILVFTTFAKQ